MVVPHQKVTSRSSHDPLVAREPVDPLIGRPSHIALAVGELTSSPLARGDVVDVAHGALLKLLADLGVSGVDRCTEMWVEGEVSGAHVGERHGTREIGSTRLTNTLMQNHRCHLCDMVPIMQNPALDR